MAKKIVLEITEAQLIALVEIVDELSAMIGVGDYDDVFRVKRVRLMDRMLKKNGFKREYK